MNSEELSELHWHTLKAMAEKAGGKYENKAQVIAFLSGEPMDAVAVPGVFDKSRDYGLISGDVEGFPGAAFSQNGHLFNARGEKLDGEVNVS